MVTGAKKSTLPPRLPPADSPQGEDEGDAYRRHSMTPMRTDTTPTTTQNNIPKQMVSSTNAAAGAKLICVKTIANTILGKIKLVQHSHTKQLSVCKISNKHRIAKIQTVESPMNEMKVFSYLQQHGKWLEFEEGMDPIPFEASSFLPEPLFSCMVHLFFV